MKSSPMPHLTRSTTYSDDSLKIFLSNLDGRINTEDLNDFFSPFGTIEHIESWTPKSAVIVFSDIEAVDRVLARHRKCTINKQEIFIRRFHYGYIERAYMDSAVLFIRLMTNDSAIPWNETVIRKCFYDYDMNIDKIRILSKSFSAFIRFKDYDIVDRILLQRKLFSIKGIPFIMKRAKAHEKLLEDNDVLIDKLLKKNKLLRRRIDQQEDDSRHEIKSLQHKIKKLKAEIDDLKSSYRHSKL